MIDVNEITKALSSTIGSERISSREFDRYAYSRDLGIANAQTPTIIVKPISTEEVSHIMKVANKYKIPVYVRGCGNSHWGAWLPYEGGILIDTTDMNSIVEMSEENLTATVESGCTWYKLDSHLESKNLTHLSSEMGGPAMTIGGCVSKAGGGPYGTCKFGFHGECDIIGFEVVLPNGEIVKTGSGALASSVSFKRYGLGPDITGLFIGSEGSLGILTKITLRVRPLPETEEYLFYNFNSWIDVVEVGDALTRPFGDELAFGMKASEGADSLGNMNAQIQVFGYEKKTITRRKKEIMDICVRNNGKEGDSRLSRDFFGRAISGIKGLFDKGVWHYGGCGSIPIRDLVDYANVWKEIVVGKYGLHDNSFGAWVYPRGWTIYVFFSFREPEDNKVIIEVSDELNKKFAEMGIAPLGIGGRDGWLPYIQNSLGTYYEFMKQIKKTLDPNNILQPGILFV